MCCCNNRNRCNNWNNNCCCNNNNCCKRCCTCCCCQDQLPGSFTICCKETCPVTQTGTWTDPNQGLPCNCSTIAF